VKEVLGLGSPIRGIGAYRALWWLSYVFSVVVVVGGSEGVSGGMRMSQWSSGEYVKMKVEVRGRLYATVVSV
jgi:hypothetical protein